MRTQNPNLSCPLAFVRQSRTFHSNNALCSFYRMHTFLNCKTFYPEYHLGLIWIQTVFANVKRERDWCRHVKVNIASADRQVERERERERDVCVCSFWISSVCFFYSGNSSTYFKVLCRSLQTKIWSYEMSSGFNSWVQSRTSNYWVRCTILTGIRSRQSEQKRFSFLRWSDPRRVTIGDPAYRIVQISGLLWLVSKLSDLICTCLALDLANSAHAGHFTDSVPMNLASVSTRLKKRKKEEIAQNHIAVFSTRFCHILTCIYTVFSHDKAHFLKFRTLAFFHKRNL